MKQITLNGEPLRFDAGINRCIHVGTDSPDFIAELGAPQEIPDGDSREQCENDHGI